LCVLHCSPRHSFRSDAHGLALRKKRQGSLPIRTTRCHCLAKSNSINSFNSCPGSSVHSAPPWLPWLNMLNRFHESDAANFCREMRSNFTGRLRCNKRCLGESAGETWSPTHGPQAPSWRWKSLRQSLGDGDGCIFSRRQQHPQIHGRIAPPTNHSHLWQPKWHCQDLSRSVKIHQGKELMTSASMVSVCMVNRSCKASCHF